jgi:RNA polymerase sigma factor (sigma-70 family)
MLRAENRTEWTDDVEAYGLESPEEDPEAVAARLSDAGALRHCLDRLEPKQRIAIVLAYVHGLTHQDIAERTGLPLGTLKSWIRRSLLSLRECLG